MPRPVLVYSHIESSCVSFRPNEGSFLHYEYRTAWTYLGLPVFSEIRLLFLPLAISYCGQILENSGKMRFFLQWNILWRASFSVPASNMNAIVWGAFLKFAASLAANACSNGNASNLPSRYVMIDCERQLAIFLWVCTERLFSVLLGCGPSNVQWKI